MFITTNYEGALTKIQADQILSNFLGKAKVTEKIFSIEYIDLLQRITAKTVSFFLKNLIFQNVNQR